MLLALAITLGTGLWAGHTQSELSGQLIRLHVVASSDSPEDQAAKLVMRDRVLELLAPLLKECRTRDEALAVIEAHTGDLEALGDVRVILGREYYPTREYGDFSLPAGEYVSLRVVMGQGQGHNWWCVVFPPLCTEALAEGAEDAFLSLDGEQKALITQEDEGYELKFRIVEWWGQLRHMFDAAG